MTGFGDHLELHAPSALLADKNVLVLGLGRNQGGAGVAQFALRHGARVRVTDLRDEAQLAPSLRALAGLPIEYVIGEHRECDIEWADVVFRNPGVPVDAPMLQLARRLGKRILMELAFFIESTDATIIGVTGTKGKTTTATLTHSLLHRHDPSALLVGNMGRSALEHLPLGADASVVAEISSFQLEGMREERVSPPVAVVTNVFPDHLDRYGTFLEYTRVKAGIAAFQRPHEWAILPWNSPHLDELERAAAGRIGYFGVGSPPDWSHVVWAEHGRIWVRWDHETTAVGELASVPLRGEHAWSNVCAAIAGTVAAGTPLSAVNEWLPTIEPVPHRLESVAVRGSVEYVNDTAATTPEAAQAGILAFQGRDIVLIAGGSEKGLDPAPLVHAARRAVRAVILLPGSATPRLEASLRAAGVELVVGPAATMADAIDAARSLAREETVVLLSPGTASFGTFIDEFDRGEQFRSAVLRLPDA